MSTSSAFIILREDLKNIEHYQGDISEAYKEAGYNLTDDKDQFNKKVNKEDIVKYIPCNRFKYMDHFTNELYDVLFELEFNSSFSVLLEDFNLSQYGLNNTEIISLALAEQILEAVNYVLSERYDRKFEEDVLNNRYIKMFGELYTPYYNYYNKEKISFDEEYETQKCIMKRVKLILDVFVEMCSDDSWNNTKHILLYRIY